MFMDGMNPAIITNHLNYHQNLGDLDFYSDLQHMTDQSSGIFTQSQYLIPIIEDILQSSSTKEFV
jgi:hypothetical protein